MLRVPCEVGAEANCFRVRVRAPSIRQAVNIAEAHYPGAVVRVVFPLDPETFANDGAAANEFDSTEAHENVVGLTDVPVRKRA